jgi:hypothetical protein
MTTSKGWPAYRNEDGRISSGGRCLGVAGVILLGGWLCGIVGLACKVATEQAIADALAQVAETDETNNTRSFAETICPL